MPVSKAMIALAGGTGSGKTTIAKRIVDRLPQLCIEHVRAPKAGNAIDCPVNNFAAHLHEATWIRIEPRDVVVVEGILLLENLTLRSLYDLKIFVDTNADVQILRRSTRDITERGRTLDSVTQHVKPINEAFVEPTKRFANLMIPEGAFNQAGFDVILAKI